MNIYEIQEEYVQIKGLLITMEQMKAAGEDVSEFEADTKKYIKTLEGSLYEKMDNIGKIIRNHEVIIDARKAEAKRLTESTKSMESSVDYLKNNLLRMLLEMSGERKLVGKTFTVTVRKSSFLDVSPVAKVPDEFIKVKTVETVDKIGLKKYIAEGNTVDGCKVVDRDNVVIK